MFILQDTYISYGVLLTTLHRNKEAHDILQQALTAHASQLNRYTDVPLIHYNIGIALWNLGQKDESKAKFHECLRFRTVMASFYSATLMVSFNIIRCELASPFLFVINSLCRMSLALS